MQPDIAIKSFTPEDRSYKRSDSGGLFIHVQPDGAKLWRFAYRFAGKQRLLSGGPYPQLSLLSACIWRDEMKRQPAFGLDPSGERRRERVAADAQQGRRVRNTFKHVARVARSIPIAGRFGTEPDQGQRQDFSARRVMVL